MQPIVTFMGFKFFETTAITKQIQRRTHRKRRINKKWLKRYGYKTVIDDSRMIRVGDCIFATPNTLKKIIAEIKERENAPGIKKNT